MVKLAKMAFGAGLIGLLLVVCAAGYIAQVPTEMTPEQEIGIVAGTAEFSIDCMDAAGGCTKTPLSDEDSMLLDNCLAYPCQKIVEWSDDETKNMTCQNVTYSWLNLSCGTKPDHDCQVSYNYCKGLYCDGVKTKNGTDTATQCYW